MTTIARKFRFTAILLSILVAAELLLRAGGFVDFPLYESDPEIGYFIRPSQSGAFLRFHSWAFNDRGMATAARWDPNSRPNLLLIGNSIVMGGNPYSQSERIAPLIQGELGGDFAVWPVAVGGWTEVNEAAYLERNPDVTAAATFFVWVVMKGGLSQLGEWRGEYVFPKRRPASAAWYVLRRYVLGTIFSIDRSELPPTGPPVAENWMRFDAAVGRLSKATNKRVPGVMVFYPDQADLAAARHGVEWLSERADLKRTAANYGLHILEVANSSDWNEGMYRDGTHPTVEGNRVLAMLISREVLRAVH